MTQQLTRLLRGTYGLAAAFLLVIVLVFVALNLGDRTFNTKMVAVTGKRLQKNGPRPSVKGCNKMVSVNAKKL